MGEKWYYDVELPHVLEPAHKAMKIGDSVHQENRAMGYPSTKLGQFKIVPKRWIVKRTFAWLGHFRRLAKDFEILVSTSENMIRIAMLKLTLAKCSLPRAVQCFSTDAFYEFFRS